jgi:type I restriction enzyme S subunit
MVFLDKELAERFKRSVARRGDLVFTCWGTIGQVGLIDSTARFDEYVVSNKQMKLTPDPAKVDSTFLYYLLGQPKSVAAMLNSAIGSSVPGFNLGQLKAWTVRLPPLSVQRRIAGVLGALDDLIDTNKRLIDEIYELCSDRYSQARANSLGTVRLGDVVDVNPWQTKSQVEGFLTYLDIAALGDGNIDWPTHSAWADAPSRARRLAKPGCTLWSTVRPNRRSHALLTHVPEDLVVSTGLAVLAPKTLGPAELYAATNESDFVDFLMSRADGSAYPAVRASTFEDAPIANLGTDASLQFEADNWPLLQMAGELSNESNQLSQTRDELLPLLLSGAVSVSGVAA